jgi:hypothetical protein
VTNDPPGAHEIEISVFGPGIGECVVVHLGDGDWLVVDSCRERGTPVPAALRYLRGMNVDVAKHLKMIVASHWHDDHVAGLDQILEEAKSALFVNSAAHEILEVARLAYLSARTPNASATRTFEKILGLLKERKQAGQRDESTGPVPALANRTLLSLSATGRQVPADVIALSPSDGVFHLAKHELADAVSAVKGRRRPVRLGANQTCVALLLQLGPIRALLGADLENSAGPTEGWNAVIHHAQPPVGAAEFFKVPHHGSENAHSDGCWNRLLCSEPVAVVTPYTPSRLPTTRDLTRIRSLTTNGYLTADPRRMAQAHYSSTVSKMVKQIAIARRPLTGDVGHVRYRLDTRRPGGVGKIELSNVAERIGG